MTQSTSTLPSSSTRAINCLLPMSFQDIPAGLTDREGHGRLTLVPGDAVAFDGAARGADCDRRTTVYGLQAHVHRPVGKRCGVPAADGEGAAVARPLDVEDVSTWPREGDLSLARHRDALKILDLASQGEKPGQGERNAYHRARQYAAGHPVPPPRRTDGRARRDA